MPGQIDIDITTRENQTVYIEGEQVGLSINVNKAVTCMFLLLAHRENQIYYFPTAFSFTKIQAGSTWIPNRDAGFRSPILPPHGKLVIHAVASQDPIPTRRQFLDSTIRGIRLFR